MDVLDGCGGELPLPPWAMADGCLKGFGGEHACAPIGAPKAMRMGLPLPPPAAFPAPPPPSTGGAIVLAPQNPPHQNQAPMGYQYGRQRTPLRPQKPLLSTSAPGRRALSLFAASTGAAVKTLRDELFRNCFFCCRPGSKMRGKDPGGGGGSMSILW